MLGHQDLGRGREGLEVLGSGDRVAKIVAPELQPRHIEGDLGLGRQDLRRLAGVGDGPSAGPFVRPEHPVHRARVLPRKGVPNVEEAVGVEVRVAVDEARALLQFRGRHVGIEPCPGVDVAPLQGDAAVGVLQVENLHVALGQAGRVQRAQQEDVRVGTLGGGDLLAPEVGDRCDRRVPAHHERGPLRPGVDVDAGERHFVGPGEQGGRPRGGREVAGAGGDVLHCLVGPGAEQPGDPDAVLFELVLQPALLLEHQADRVVAGVVDPDLGGRLLLCRHGLPRQAQRRGQRQQRQKQAPRRADARATGGDSDGAVRCVGPMHVRSSVDLAFIPSPG